MIGRLSLDQLHWDDWNRDHIAKHAVLPEEVEEVIAGLPKVSETYKQRLQLIGPTLVGRMLSIVVGAVPGRPGIYYVFSARPASRKERGLYEQTKGGSLP
ncbi:MAG: BrnT family toxin [Chloroflexi bacterium]|nr:BrnT family toxin [Chloroflexota bacterium]